MKKVVIVNSQVPFVHGGAEYLAEELRKTIWECGHKAEIVNIPFKWYPPETIPKHILACRLLDLTQASGEDVDLIIGLKFPAYYVKHPNKVMWILHQFRQAYDLWGTNYEDMSSTPDGHSIRDIVIQSDNTFLREASKIFAISKLVAGRLKDFNNIDAEPLYPPVENPDKFSSEEYGDFLFYPSRINIMKRQALAIESMKYTRTDAKLIIAGQADNNQYLDYLRDIIRKYRLAGKVELAGKISEEKKIALLAHARGCLFIPYNEDYGYVTLESFYARKPLITCTDSGGPCEFVENGVNGYIVPPEPEALADAIDDLCGDKKKAKDFGLAGYEKISSLDITWEGVARALIG